MVREMKEAAAAPGSDGKSLKTAATMNNDSDDSACSGDGDMHTVDHRNGIRLSRSHRRKQSIQSIYEDDGASFVCPFSLKCLTTGTCPKMTSNCSAFVLFFPHPSLMRVGVSLALCMCMCMCMCVKPSYVLWIIYLVGLLQQAASVSMPDNLVQAHRQLIQQQVCAHSSCRTFVVTRAHPRTHAHTHEGATTATRYTQRHLLCFRAVVAQCINKKKTVVCVVLHTQLPSPAGFGGSDMNGPP